MIGVIQYGIGNIGSVKNALDHLNIPNVVTADQNQLSSCDRLILPGVGAFEPAMNILSDLKFDSFIKDWANDGKPILGICLGMQLLLSSSEENGVTKGLGLISGHVSPLLESDRKIHIGWNKVEPIAKNDIITESGFAYFVHSYACRQENESHIIAQTTYGESFTSAIQKNNVIGVQFHPEKSQDFGLDILRRFSLGEI
ncbi:MAG TPA: imidazole glycerol phosphate synthase subunit HisH [Candidatus Marinimicrobia bacterium]|jgi:glutamine amidotransferase|nr:imidazole glycerol phosphate synthase subunit HisH [Candidatus Neomarinimicrobiota bacterium]|tara:strand:+ start:1310 stop:1906 length:597 start_codon:yes stop_codon:yes gene_type:complete